MDIFADSVSNQFEFPSPLSESSPIPFSISHFPPPLTPAQISSIRDDCVAFMEFGTVSSHEVRTLCEAKPASAPLTANFLNSRDLFQRSMESMSAGNIDVLLGQALRARRYGDAVKVCEFATNCAPNHLRIYQFVGFIAAILDGDDEGETMFYECISDMLPRDGEMCHFIDILDELYLLQQTDEKAPLIEMMFGDTTEIRTAMHTKLHLIPEIVFDKNHRPIPENDNDKISLEIDFQKGQLPMLEPVGEGIEVANKEQLLVQVPTQKNFTAKNNRNQKSRNKVVTKSKEETDVLNLISRSNWLGAISLATDLINKNPDDHEMYLHRAFALINCYKIQDAILDCTRSLKLKKTDKALQMRASFWLMLGDPEMCRINLNQLENKSSLLSSLPSSSKSQNMSTLNQKKTKK